MPAASRDAEIDAPVGLVPAEASPAAIAAASLVQPALMLAGPDEGITPIEQHQRPIHEALPSGCKQLVTLGGASHCTFAESGFLCGVAELIYSGSSTRAVQHAAVLSLPVPWPDTALRAGAGRVRGSPRAAPVPAEEGAADADRCATVPLQATPAERSDQVSR